jgi:hypothetical protein
MKNEILELRESGKSYDEIVNILGCSKSTVSYHCNPNVRNKAIRDAVEYKSRKRENLPTKSSNDVNCYCLNCNSIVMKRRNWSKNNRKFCNKECELNHKENTLLNDWKSGKHCGYVLNKNLNISSFVRRYIKNKFNNECVECGWSEKNPYSDISYLEIHHIDGDASNCIEDNLTLLCPNCHSLTENYKFLNDKSSRIKR